MAVTLTFGANSQPLQVADVSTISQYQRSPMRTTGTSAAGAVHFKNIKIPHGATILDVVVHHRQDDSTAGHVHTVGIAGGITSAALFGSESFSQTIRAVSYMSMPHAGSMPYKVSVSDDATQRYVWPTVTSATTGTDSISLSIGLTVTWTMTRTDATGQ